MRQRRTLRLVSAATTLIALLTLSRMPAAQADPAGPAAAAESYGLWLDAGLLPVHASVKAGPLAWSAQDAPPGAAQPAEAQVAEAGPLPADGSLVNHVGVMTSSSTATGSPTTASAFTQTADVSLLAQAGVPRISADLVRAQANADCTRDPHATGTTFVNLKVNGTPITATPPPNTVIDLLVAKVILNEQRPAFDGRGIVVNAIHVVSTTAGDGLFRGDLVVSHALATVNCPGGPGTTGGTNPVQITKTVSPSTASAGDQVTYTATFTNKATAACLVNQAIDHLPVGFSPVSTQGALGATFTQRNRPNGGVDVLVGNGVVIPAGKSATQTFVVKVGDTVAPGVYYNDVELFCANLGNFVKGLDAPVEIVAEAPAPAAPAPTPTDDSRSLTPRELPATGGGVAAGSAAAVIAAAVGLSRLARRQH